MPFVVDRRTGKIISAPELTQEQKDLAWEMIVKSWIQKNRDEFLERCASRNSPEIESTMQAENGTEHTGSGEDGKA